MILVIAEKPSVAKSIATVIGATVKKDGYFEGNNYLVSWCVGHLVELAMPVAYGEQYKHWNVEDLPLIPEKFLYRISSKTGAQFKILRDLMQRSDVDELIEATDAGREGELIFRLVYNQAACRKPFKRLWISSMEASSIRNGMTNLRPGAEYDNLYHAAMARQKADWLVGINASRLYTALYHRKLSIGRVQTPTLQLIVQRYRQRNEFRPTPYYRLSVDLGGWKLYHGLTVEDCEKDEATAKRIAACMCGTAVKIISVERTEKKENAPALYDLTTLQRDANRLLGYTAKQTLDYLQSLYDHELTTYPRTDSRYLTHDMEDSTQQLLYHLLQEDCFAAIKRAADPASWNVRQCINDKKVSDHHAILPSASVTSQKVAELPTGERSILTLITARLFTAVAAPHLYRATKITASNDATSTPWAATGREDLQQGHKTLSGVLRSLLNLKEDTSESSIEETFPLLEAGQTFPVLDVKLEGKKAKPPVLYTEDTLLSAMETAGKDLNDPALREAMKGSGLGTPATRAAIIESLIKTGYVERIKKALSPTPTGLMLIDMVDNQLKSPPLTGQWECLLTQIAAGHVSEDAFLEEVKSFTEDVITNGKATYSDSNAPKMQEAEIIGYCPLCGRPIKENSKSYGCTGYRDKGNPCQWSLWKKIAGKSITPKVAGQLVNNRRSTLIKGLTSKNGKKFDAYLVLDNDGKVRFEFPKCN